MADLLSQLVNLIDKGTVEQRCAALLVLGALKLRSAPAAKSAAAALDHANPVVKDFAFRYFEETEVKDSVTTFLKFLDGGDKEIQERTVRLLIKTGAAAVQLLVKTAPGASRVWQLNAARVLCAARNKAALKGLLQMLSTGNDEFNKSVCDLLTPVVREMESKEQEQFYGEVLDFAVELDIKQQRSAMVSAMRLLGQLGRAPARRWLFKFVGPEQPSVIRYHALVALTNYDLVYAMTAGGPGTATTLLSFRIWQESFSMMNFGTGSAIAFLLVLLSLAFMAAILRALPTQLLPGR